MLYPANWIREKEQPGGTRNMEVLKSLRLDQTQIFEFGGYYINKSVSIVPATISMAGQIPL